MMRMNRNDIKAIYHGTEACYAMITLGLSNLALQTRELKPIESCDAENTRWGLEI
jgi:hypothetical protein